MPIDDVASHRFGSSLEGLNTRIARLAIGLGVDLDNQSAVNALMERPQIMPVAHERRAADSAGRSGSSGERRTAHLREELRGLLVLRYHLETDSFNDNGLTVTRQLIERAQQHLIQQGFKPGADGLRLDDLFKAE